MAGYWNASELALLLPQPNLGYAPVTATSQPLNASGFQTLIDMRSGEFDSAAAHAGYTVPIATGASAGFLYARLVVGIGARADALSQIYPGQSKKADELHGAYVRILEQIRSGNMPIIAPRDPGQTGRVLPRHSGIASPVISASMGLPRDLSIPNDF